MPKKYNFQGNVSSEGTASLDIFFPDSEPTNEEKIGVLANTLADAATYMLQQGYLPPESRLMSSRDVASEFGHTRQYWEKLLNEDKIPFKETAAGRITCDIWVQGYLDNKERVDEYVRNRNKAVRVIEETGKRHGKIACPRCKQEAFDYHINTASINGLCRAGCGFRIHTTV
jgi:hypothetical protein